MASVSLGMVTQAETGGVVPADTGSFTYGVVYEFMDVIQPIISPTAPFYGEGGWVAGPDDALYGIASSSIVRWAGPGDVKWLHNFTGPNGWLPSTLMLASDGDFYGTTQFGGAGWDPNSPYGQHGTVFRLSASGEFTTLHSFSGTDGSRPMSQLLQASDGYLYGSTMLGGTTYNLNPITGNPGGGTIFRMSLVGALETLYSAPMLPNASPLGLVPWHGVGPVGVLAEGTDGNIYGTMMAGGNVNKGTVFKLFPPGSPSNPTAAAIVTDIHAFGVDDEYTGFDYGAWRGTGLTRGPDGNLYGTAEVAGDIGEGTWPPGVVYRITPDGDFTLLHTFGPEDGTNAPRTPLVLASDGHLYGTTSGDAPFGVSYPGGGVFRISVDGDFEMLHHFDDDVGGRPDWPLVQAADGHLYGPARSETVPRGFLYRVSLDGEVTHAQVFAAGDIGGRGPRGALVEGSDGNFYGTTTAGGQHGEGVVFKLTPAGDTAVLHSFNGPEGRVPRGGLIFGSDGHMYGTTYRGGNDDRGTIYRLTTAGEFTLLHSLNGETDGGGPKDVELVQLPDGNLYGATESGGGPGYRGTVFRISPDGEFATVHQFTGQTPHGRAPRVGLTPGPGGALYGTTDFGGEEPTNAGTVFKLTLDGEYTSLHTFDDANGYQPHAKLLWAADGNLYGTTHLGGDNGAGTIYRITADGTLTTLHHFAAGPQCDGCDLIEASDGLLYGATRGGGTNGNGEVYRLDPASGVVTTIHSFGSEDPAGLRVALTEAADGNTYGVNELGGTGWGTIFRLTATGE